MTLHEDVKFLDKQLESIQTVEKLRTLLSSRDLKLIVVLFTNEFSCLEWDVTHKQVSKLLDLGLRIRISRITDEKNVLETVHTEPIRVKEANWLDLEDLFNVLKQGIKKATGKELKRNKMTTND